MWTSDNPCVARWVWNELNLLSLGRHDLFCVVMIHILNRIQMETASRLGQHCDRSMIEDRVEDLLKVILRKYRWQSHYFEYIESTKISILPEPKGDFRLWQGIEPQKAEVHVFTVEAKSHWYVHQYVGHFSKLNRNQQIRIDRKQG